MGKDAIFISWDTQRETSAEEKRATPPTRFCMTDCPWFVFGRPVIPSGNYRQKCWSGGIKKVYYGECANGKCKKKNHMKVPWEKYRAENSVNLINNPLVFFFSKFLESYTSSTNRRPSSSWGVEKRRFMWYYTTLYPFPILQKLSCINLASRYFLWSGSQEKNCTAGLPDDRPFMTKAVICALLSKSSDLLYIHFPFPPLKTPVKNCMKDGCHRISLRPR